MENSLKQMSALLHASEGVVRRKFRGVKNVDDAKKIYMLVREVLEFPLTIDEEYEFGLISEDQYKKLLKQRDEEKKRKIDAKNTTK